MPLFLSYSFVLFQFYFVVFFSSVYFIVCVFFSSSFLFIFESRIFSEGTFLSEDKTCNTVLKARNKICPMCIVLLGLSFDAEIRKCHQLQMKC